MNASVHAIDIEQTLSVLEANVAVGLTSEEASERLKDHGYNRPTQPPRKSFITKILEQFKDTPVIILIAAAVVSVIFGGGEAFERFRDTIIILAVLIASMAIGISRENRADKALREIKDTASPKANVKRDGQIKRIDASELVPGDIVMFTAGDYITADVRLIETANMRIDESSLTGEFGGVKKQAHIIAPEDAPPAERANIAYMGSMVTYGRGAGVVFATGINTEAGRIAASRKAADKTATDRTAAIPVEEDDVKTLMQDKLGSTAKSLGILFLAAYVLVFLIGMLYNFLGFGDYRDHIEMFLISASLAVAAVPGGIAIMAAVILALGVKRMVDSNVLVKKLRAVETLGSTTVICSGKTGTLTQNMMTVVSVADPENLYEVTGVGYKAKGIVVSDGIVSRNIALVAEIAVLCNDATFDKRTSQITGDPTEGALLVFGAKLGQEKASLNAANQRIHEIPFDSARKMMSTYNMQSGKIIMNTKGAPETIINRSSGVYLDGEIVPMSESIRRRLLAQNEELASKALRVLAFAYKEYDSVDVIDNVEDDLIYAGMMCLIDPLREDVKESIEKCRTAGINVKMVTGDHKLTATAAAIQLGLIENGDEVIEGSELYDLSDEALTEMVGHINVFARVSPELKARIATAIKRSNNVVAMTGGGVNDAPSLKIADVGIAMEPTGTDAAKEAADVILTDDSFVSIASAVEQSRTVYGNIRKAVSYLLGCNLGVTFVILVAIIFSLPTPLVATQILFLGLLMVTLPAFALGSLKKESGIMRRKPRDLKVAMFSRRTFSSVIARAVFIFVGAIAAYLYGSFIADAPNGGQHALAMSMCFATLVIVNVLIAYPSKAEGSIWSGKVLLNSRLLNVSLLLSIAFLTAIMYVPFLSDMFSVVPLSIGQAILCLVIALITASGFELSKRNA